jgi:hypothetical protein
LIRAILPPCFSFSGRAAFVEEAAANIVADGIRNRAS